MPREGLNARKKCAPEELARQERIAMEWVLVSRSYVAAENCFDNSALSVVGLSPRAGRPSAPLESGLFRGFLRRTRERLPMNGADGPHGVACDCWRVEAEWQASSLLRPPEVDILVARTAAFALPQSQRYQEPQSATCSPAGSTSWSSALQPTSSFEFGPQVDRHGRVPV
jgi:hypothetical protein